MLAGDGATHAVGSAAEFSDRKRSELLNKYKDYELSSSSAEDAANEPSSEEEEGEDEDEEEEDEEAEQLTPEVNSRVLEVLGLIKTRDRSIYNSEVKFFSEKDIALEPSDGPKAEPPVFLKDYVRKELMSEKYHSEDVEEERGDTPTLEELPHSAQQEKIKRDFLQAIEEAHESDDGDDNEFLKKVERPRQDKEAEERSFQLFMEEQKRAVGEKYSGLNALQQFWSNPTLDEEEKFLRDYIVHQKWKCQPGSANNSLDVDVDIADWKALEAQEKFEQEYNFRFEEEGATDIVTHPRDVPSVRQKVSRRKRQRLAKKRRKEELKRQQEEKLKALKSEKKKEILEKLKEIQKASGLKDVPDLQDMDFEAEFDADAHDRMMQEMFDADYYQDGDDQIMSKPYDDAESNSQNDTMDQLISKKIEEYYDLHYEDMIDDIPCRFKYTSVPKKTYGLSFEEMLTLDDKELNKRVPIKRLAPYRNNNKPNVNKNAKAPLLKFAHQLSTTSSGKSSTSRKRHSNKRKRGK